MAVVARLEMTKHAGRSEQRDGRGKAASGCSGADTRIFITALWKLGALRPQKPLRLFRGGEVGGSGIFMPNTYSLRCHHRNDSALRWAAV